MSQRCSKTTKIGTRCSRTATYGKYCRQHAQLGGTIPTYYRQHSQLGGTIPVSIRYGARSVSVEADQNETYESFVCKVSGKIGLSPTKFRLGWAGRYLDNNLLWNAIEQGGIAVIVI